MGVSVSTAVILPVVASTQTSVRSLLGGCATSTDQISTPFSFSSSTHLIEPRLTLANAILLASCFVTCACLRSSASLSCAHKLQGAQLVASANAMTDLATGFIGTSTDRVNTFSDPRNASRYSTLPIALAIVSTVLSQANADY